MMQSFQKCGAAVIQELDENARQLSGSADLSCLYCLDQATSGQFSFRFCRAYSSKVQGSLLFAGARFHDLI